MTTQQLADPPPAAAAVLDAIAGRRSNPKLVEPAPAAHQVAAMAHAAECAPDYMDLRPWRLILLEGDDLHAMGEAFAQAVKARKEGDGVEPAAVETSMAKARSKFNRSPMVMAVVFSPRPHRKVRWEDQLACASAVCQNILLAATAFGYGSMWRTDHECQHPGVLEALGVGDGELIVGLLHVGTVPEGPVRIRTCRRRPPAEQVGAAERFGYGPGGRAGPSAGPAMTSEDHRSLDTWRRPGVRGYLDEERHPRRPSRRPQAIAAALVAADRPQAALVLDVGSGPGTFLAAFLDALPGARGIWTDGSEAMLAPARRRLAPYGDRVEHRLADMADLGAATLPPELDALVTSRALHHLGAPGLPAFYVTATSLLAPGGWLVNLDHVSHRGREWDDRLRSLRERFVPRTAPESSHPHDHPLPTLEDHLEALTAAGITDVEVVWKSFFTCLVMGRKSDRPT